VPKPMILNSIPHAFLDAKRWWIAYSGGVDSHVLLHAIAQFRKANPDTPPLAAIHINHQINPRAADWAQHCQHVCAELGIELHVETVSVIGDGEGLEAAARRARYAAFERCIGENEVLLQAHHRDDQIETLLLRLLRGSGIAGLAAIPEQRALGRGRLLRPLLNHTRAELIAYAQQHELKWIDDDSNRDPHYDRNFLRLEVLPLLEQRWPAYRDTLARVSEQATEAQLALDDLTAADSTSVISADGSLAIAGCRALTPPRLHGVLRYWLQQRGLPLPSRQQLRQIVEAFNAREDAEPCVQWPGVEVRRFREHLYAMPPLLPSPAFDVAWQPPQPLTITGIGTVQATPQIGAGLRADLDYRVRHRSGGERCKPLGRAHSQTLKKLLQASALPPWWRDRLPLIYCGDEIAAVGDLWICEGFAAPAGQSGWDIEWLRVGTA